jgi:hypothetical protein
MIPIRSAFRVETKIKPVASLYRSFGHLLVNSRYWVDDIARNVLWCSMKPSEQG